MSITLASTTHGEDLEARGCAERGRQPISHGASFRRGRPHSVEVVLEPRRANDVERGGGHELGHIDHLAVLPVEEGMPRVLDLLVNQSKTQRTYILGGAVERPRDSLDRRGAERRAEKSALVPMILTLRPNDPSAQQAFVRRAVERRLVEGHTVVLQDRLDSCRIGYSEGPPVLLSALHTNSETHEERVAVFEHGPVLPRPGVPQSPGRVPIDIPLIAVKPVRLRWSGKSAYPRRRQEALEQQECDGEPEGSGRERDGREFDGHGA